MVVPGRHGAPSKERVAVAGAQWRPRQAVEARHAAGRLATQVLVVHVVVERHKRRVAGARDDVKAVVVRQDRKHFHQIVEFQAVLLLVDLDDAAGQGGVRERVRRIRVVAGHGGRSSPTRCCCGRCITSTRGRWCGSRTGRHVGYCTCPLRLARWGALDRVRKLPRSEASS